MAVRGEAARTVVSRAWHVGAAAAKRLGGVLSRFTLVQRFMVVSLVILIGGAYVIGSYVASEIKGGVTQRTSAITALYVDSFISPHLQELSRQESISAVKFDRLDTLLTTTSLGQRIASFKVWDSNGRVVYANDHRLVGQSFPIGPGLAKALAGEIHTSVSSLRGDENLYERTGWHRLLETYAPVHADETGAIIGVSEFYQDPGELESQISSSQRESWLIVGGSTAIIYLLLVAMVKGASSTIASQHRRLDALAVRNAALAQRVRRAAARKTETDERLLRRTAQDVHDGPIQDVTAAMLGLDALRAQVPGGAKGENGVGEGFELVQSALQDALKEMRQISAGLVLPELNSLSVSEVVEKVAAAHTKKTGNRVHLSLAPELPPVDLSVKIAVYRVIQEALNNAYRYSGADEQEVEVVLKRGKLGLRIRDQGVGLPEDGAAEGAPGETLRLGLRGMRERLEVLGGKLQVVSSPGMGCVVKAKIPIS